MSNRYKGGIISATPPTTSTAAASGAWTLEQQMQAQAAGTWPSPPIFIEDLFSTYLYTGNSPSTQSIANGIDLATYGGLVWCKSRVSGDGSTYNNILMDTARGTGSGNILYSNSILAAQTAPNAGISSYNSNGFSLRYDDGYGTNYPSGGTFASWTFREQPKFFDIVTYTGNGTAGRNISHSLGSVPGCIIVKCVTQNEPWYVYHQSLGNTKTMVLNTTDAEGTDPSWNNTTPTASVFTVGSNSQVNFSGRTYVAYLFAHNAGGFPVSGGGSTNGISCGSFTTDGSGNATVNLGYEPQWLMYKCSSAVGDWEMVDVMRGWVVGVNNDNGLRANSSDAESTGSNRGEPSSTGFNCVSFPTSRDFIYIAIRRGPMKTPTVGTSVFSPNAYTGGTAGTSFNLGFVPDTLLTMRRNTSNFNILQSRLTGLQYMFTYSTAAETTASSGMPTWDANTGTTKLATATAVTGWNASGSTYVNEAFARAPGFFDEVCWSGNSTANTAIYHNLTVTPELLIMKARNATNEWNVHTNFGATTYIKTYLNFDYAGSTSTYGAGNTLFSAPTASSFAVGGTNDSNETGYNYVAYLFATLAGVSKVGSYTGTGTTQIINCGFTAGSRFVLIKRTDSTGDWYVWDSARGIIAGDDPYLLLNSTAAEVTNTDYIDTDNSGFQISSTAPAAINASAGTFIFLAIA